MGGYNGNTGNKGNQIYKRSTTRKGYNKLTTEDKTIDYGSPNIKQHIRMVLKEQVHHANNKQD